MGKRIRNIRKTIENVVGNILQFYSVREGLKDENNGLMRWYLNGLIRSLFREKEEILFKCPLCKKAQPMNKYIGSDQLTIPLGIRKSFIGFEDHDVHWVENRFGIAEGDFCIDCIAPRKITCYYCNKEYSEVDIFLRGEKPMCYRCYPEKGSEAIKERLRINENRKKENQKKPKQLTSEK
ncbi:MAG: hypothetical protein ACTSQI_22125 [Candidatus Helarchaeota archaeon]